jgi:Indole-3-glycerol phosphate synthase
MSTFLDKIISDKRKRVESARAIRSLNEIRDEAEQRDVVAHRFAHAISGLEPNIIAEFKRASPSKGVINDQLGPVETAAIYRSGGASAISVLTEEDHFLGSLDDLLAIKNTVDLPLLRKDFVIDEYQIYQSAVAGASAVLLIVAALPTVTLMTFQALANSLSLDVIVEVHDLDEMQIAIEIGATIIGVNNRNLKTFEVTLDVSRELIKMRPANALTIAESGISNADEISELHSLGYNAFLIGESLMRSGDPAAELRRLNGKS